MFTFLVFNNNFDSNLLLLSQNWRHNLKRAKKNDDLMVLSADLGRSSGLDRFKKYSTMYPKAHVGLGFWERVVGVLCWPILLGVF